MILDLSVAAIVTGRASGLGRRPNGIRVNMPQQLQDSLAAMVPFSKRLGTSAAYAGPALFMLEHHGFDGAIRVGPK